VVAGLIAGFTRLLTGATAVWHVQPRSARVRVYFANHSSHADFATIWAALPPDVRERARPVAAADYWQRGTVRRYLAARVFRAVLIDRAGGGRAATEQMVAALRSGDSLIIFPEGTRGDGSAIAPFRSGLYHLAVAFPQAELIPVRLVNLNRVLPKGETIPVPVIARLTFGQPLALRTGESRESLLRRAQTAVAALDDAVTADRSVS
jgi:1-acyl-sn-glycerol-3-phosphate acyltransferase